ncbi:MAG: hypothetical protein GY822_24655 [Deltaproteobacteria bacterium]|nr:hypothetical protein [Deltaproteobacteria bacterium]
MENRKTAQKFSLYGRSSKDQVAFLLFCISLVTTSLGWATAGTYRGPYLGHITEDAVSILWETPQNSIGSVHCGLASVDEHSASSLTPASHHSIRLTGLSTLGSAGTEFSMNCASTAKRFAVELS